MRVAVLCLLLALPSIVVGENWPQFRGPTGQGVAAAHGLPVEWSETVGVDWKTEVDGKGWSSPVVWGDQIWLTTAIENIPTPQEREDLLAGIEQPQQRQIAKSISLRFVCVDRRDGRQRFSSELFNVEKPDPIHLLNSYASPTPVIEGGRVYCHFGTYGTACIDTQNGNVLWQTRLPLQHAVGPGSSPILWNDLLILVCDGMDQQYVAALDKYTGETVWKTPRPPMSGDDGDFHKAYCSPLAINWEGQDQLLIPGAQWFVSYEPSTGDMLWQVNHGRGFSNVASAVFADGDAYLITGFTKPELWAIPVAVRGEITRDRATWTQTKLIPKKPSPLIVDDTIYVISDSGVLSCIDRADGKILWSARLGGNYSASPLLADGRIYFASHEGEVTVVEPSREGLRKLAENELDGQLMASPIAVDGALFFRSDRHLYRIASPRKGA